MQFQFSAFSVFILFFVEVHEVDGWVVWCNRTFMDREKKKRNMQSFHHATCVTQSSIFDYVECVVHCANVQNELLQFSPPIEKSQGGFNNNVFIIFPNQFFKETVHILLNWNHYYELNCAHNLQSHFHIFTRQQPYLCCQCSSPKQANPTLFQFLPFT